MKAERNKTIDISVEEGKHYLDRCIRVSARTSLKNNNLVLGNVEHRYDESVSAGLIISQDVKENEKLPEHVVYNMASATDVTLNEAVGMFLVLHE